MEAWRIRLSWRYLISFVGVWLTYWLAKIAVEVSPTRENWLGEVTQYLLCIGACAFIAFGLAIALGTHQEDSDPVLGGGGYTVVDYEPTKDERSKHALVVFLCLAILALYGTSKALQESRTCTTCGCSGFHQEDCPDKRK